MALTSGQQPGMSSTEKAARQAKDSKPVEALARLGLAARGLVYVVIGLIAVQIAVGKGGEADRNGALGAIRKQPFGQVLLVVLAVGFAGYAAWRLLEAAVGHQDEQGGKKLMKRLGSLVRALLYGSFAITTLTFVSSGGSQDRTRPLTARVMAMTGGQLLVGAAGVAVIGGGLYMAYRGLSRKFLKKLTLPSPTSRTLAKRLGTAGLVGRGLVFCLIGGFLVEAAVTFDPKKAKGLDAALKTLAQQAFGTVLLLIAALGLLAFGAWSFVEARYRDV